MIAALRPRPPRSPVLLPLVLCLAAAGCDDPGAPPRPQSCAALADGEVALTVTEGTTPTFAWSPACYANELRVSQVEPGDFASTWIAFGLMLTPPIVYGEQPATIPFPLPPAPPLAEGVEYEAVLGMFAPGGASVEVARVTFTP